MKLYFRLLLYMTCVTGVVVGCRLPTGVCCRLWRSSLKNDKTTHRAEAKERKNSHEERRDNRLALPAMEVVTNFRASIMIITCITILAVDFQVGLWDRALQY